nr:MAG TPA: hypothetical protein [Caudoviricetes sp.]
MAVFACRLYRPHCSRKERDFQCLATPLINFLVSPLRR